MTPRLPSSKKWTQIPADFAEKVIQVFSDNFEEESEEGVFLFEGRIYPEEVMVRTGYLEDGRLRQVNFEASMAYDAEKKDAFDRLYDCIDATATMMEKYFVMRQELGEQDLSDEDEDGAIDAFDFPLHWKSIEFEGRSLFVQYSTVNSKLEEEADRLLGLAEKAVVHEHSETEDALALSVVNNELAQHIQTEIRKKAGLPENDLN